VIQKRANQNSRKAQIQKIAKFDIDTRSTKSTNVKVHNNEHSITLHVA